MDSLREHFLACSGRTVEQHRSLRGRDLSCQLDHLLGRR